MRFLSFIIGLIFFVQTPCFAFSIEAFPKGETYDHPRFIKLQSDNPETKIIWTLNPNGSLDEAFVYESPIPIRFSQELWFFAIFDENKSTPFQKEKYTIRTDPRRYSRNVFISSFSPVSDTVEIMNTGDQRVSLRDWRVEGNYANFTFEEPKFLDARTSIIIPLALGDVMDSITLKSPDYFPKDIFRYKLRADVTQSNFIRNANERFILR